MTIALARIASEKWIHYPSAKALSVMIFNGDGMKTACIMFQGCLDKDGYGVLSGSRAHRISYAKAIGPIPYGLQVLHKCDNPGCINPEHLFLGTNQDNVDDKLAKGRQPTGSTNGRAKLDEQAVVEILSSKLPERTLAAQYGVSNAVIGSIRRRKTWTHVPVI